MLLFISVGIGISVGSENLVVAVVGTAVIGAVTLYLHWSRFGARVGHDAGS